MIFGFRTYPKIIVICRSIFDPFLVQFWSILGGILGPKIEKGTEKNGRFREVASGGGLGRHFGRFWDVFGGHFGGLGGHFGGLGAILEAFWRLLEALGGSWRLLEALGHASKLLKLLENLEN